MYHDQLEDQADHTALQLATVQAVIASLLHGPYLVPAVKIVCPGGFLICSGEPQPAARCDRLMKPARRFVWLRPGWLFPLRAGDYYTSPASPWWGPEGSGFAEHLQTVGQSPKWLREIRDPFFSTHAARVVPYSWYVAYDHSQAVELFDALQ
jgi:hypothetical protein